MRTLIALGVAWAVWFAAGGAVHAADGRISIVAAENFYGDVARQIGGEQVSVASILSNPDQDPHLFETTPSVVRDVAAAQIVIYNGDNYDAWMPRLLAATPRGKRLVIVAADLVGKAAANNPHIWYDPPTMPAVAKAIAAALATLDPGHQADFTARLKMFLASLEPLQAKIGMLAAKYAGTPVIATEPVFGYMAAALHLQMHGERFQLAIMNNTEPSAHDTAAFEGDLRSHKVRIVFYNKQAADELVRHLVELASASAIPVVGVTETCPAGLSYQEWIAGELNETEKALAGSSS
jgi:zinc/manganese transport system substrate-binding protein